MTPERWSLSARFLRGLALGLAGVLAVSVSVSAWYLVRSTERELAALLVEELDEIEARFPERPGEPQTWEAVLRDLEAHHPGQSIALRVWDERGGALLAETGPPWLLGPDEPAPEPLEETVRGRGHLRWRARRMHGAHVVAVAIDASARYALLRSFGRRAGVLVLLASLLALGGGAVFCRRATRLLHEVADRARSVRSPDEELDMTIPGAPDEIREVADALAEMHANVRREADRTKLLVAGLAHELRSPLQYLMGSTEVALLDENLPADVSELLRRQLDELHELSDSVHNLVSLCKPARAPGGGIVERFDLGEEAELRLSRERELAARRGITLVLDREGDLVLAGDREALLRAVRNLAANAVQWTGAEGTVRVRLAGDRSGVSVVVDDEGPGVPAELRDVIFEPFVQGPVSAGRRAGYGLGLALARSAVEAQGGSLRVGRAPSGGARFEMSLPRTPSVTALSGSRATIATG